MKSLQIDVGPSASESFKRISGRWKIINFATDDFFNAIGPSDIRF